MNKYSFPLLFFFFFAALSLPLRAEEKKEIVLSWWSAVYPEDTGLRGEFLSKAESLTQRLILSPNASFHEKTDAVRHFIFNNSDHKIDQEFYRYWHSIPALLTMLDLYAANPQSYKPHMECATRSMTMFWMLKALEIRARAVVIYRADNVSDSHTFLEAFNPETQEWEIQDPDYNAYWIFAKSGERAGVEDLLVHPVEETFVPCTKPGNCGYWQRIRSKLPHFGLASVLDIESGRYPILVNTDRFPDNAGAFYRAGQKTAYCALFQGDCYSEIITLQNKKQ